jgi:PTS system mannitol-specific IIC component
VVERLTEAAGDGVDFLVDNSLLPLVSLIVEPAKVLFLNNAINHGVLSPLGIAEAADEGKSILFMIETNPGPGLGVLTAYLLFGPRALRPTVPGAMIIHFLGGIHEIYFPYILMKPRLILAAIAGGMAGVTTAMITNAGLVAPPSPGSIFAYMTATPRGGYVSVLLSVIVAAAVSFAVGSALLGFGRGEKDSPLETPEEAGSHTVPATRSASSSSASASQPVSRTATTEA